MNTSDINSRIEESTKRGIRFLSSIQEKDGSWVGDYGGPMFLLPMYVGACYITGEKISEKEKNCIITYFKNNQNENGSIGIHVEDTGMMFTTVLSYTALRFLDIPKDTPFLQKMRHWILSNGTALGAASWGKFFLSLLNLYPYEGLNPILPELWRLPYALPFHPGRLWCHARQVYLPMAYLYGIKAKIPENDLIYKIREEIYDKKFSEIKFSEYRNFVSKTDDYIPYSSILKTANSLMICYEKLHLKKFREKSLSVLFDHILYEDIVTNFIDIGPVNSILNTIVHYFSDKDGKYFAESMKALKLYLWHDNEEIKMNGYNSTALWDTAFAVQSVLSTGFEKDFIPCLKKAYMYIKDNQVTDNVPNNELYFRHISRGGWPFSDKKHGWPISDCTAEGFKSAVALESILNDPFSEELLIESVKLILSFQNKDGGWATYEKTRGGRWLELMNPSSVFGKIMIDYSYVECTSACIQALVKARLKFSDIFNKKLEQAVNRGIEFIKKEQRQDGSWEGSWAVCFTYGTWFAVSGLIAAGISKNAVEIKKAVSFLLEKQNGDGGWGESYLSCKEERWINHAESQVVNTSWAAMTLIKAGMANSQAVRKAIMFLINKQKENGDWPRESIVGIFNKTTLINYENYRRYFSIWALGLYLNENKYE
jgi:squalene/oxidosqualene cyclase-like protein